MTLPGNVGHVYAMGTKNNVRVKVGYTCRTPEQRRLGVQSEAKESVSLLHAIKVINPCVVEEQVHEFYADLRIQGEWFALTGDILATFPELVRGLGMRYVEHAHVASYDAFFSRHLRERRESLTWSIERLGRHSGIFPSYIRTIEREAPLVSLDSASRLAQAMGVTVDFLCRKEAP